MSNKRLWPTIAGGLTACVIAGGVGGWMCFLWQRESLVEQTRQAVIAEFPPELVALKGRSLQVADGYPYLPDDSDLYIPTWADWQRVRTNAARNCEEYLTDRLKRRSFVITQGPDHQVVGVDTWPQPDWLDAWKGKGRFSCSDRELRATYQEAAEATMITVKSYFSGATTENTLVSLTIMGYPVGVYWNGKLTLEGEE